MSDLGPYVVQSNGHRPAIELTLMGIFGLTVDGVPTPQMPKPCQQLFALLALAEGRGVPREKAALTIWPDAPTGTSRFYLRRTLMQCRDALKARREWLEDTDTEAIRLVDRDVRVDLWSFGRLCGSDRVEELVDAFEMGQQEFLLGSKASWVAVERMRILLRSQAACLRAARIRRQSGDFSGALELLSRCHQIDPLDEAVLLPFWESLVETGQEKRFQDSYLRTLARYEKSGMALTPSLADAAKRLFRHVELPESKSPTIVDVANAPFSLDGLGPLVGREQVIRRAAELLKTNRVLEISGPPGIGKTRLALEIARRLGWPAQYSTSLEMDAPAELRHRRSLAIVDLGERTQIGAVSSIESTLSRNSYLRILVLSRSRVTGGDAANLPLGPLSPDDSAVVFAALNGTRDIDEVQIADLVQRLDGNPLALRIAANHSRLYGVSETLRVLDRAEPEHDLVCQLRAKIVSPWLATLTQTEATAIAVLSELPGSFSLGLARFLTPEPLQVSFDSFASDALKRFRARVDDAEGYMRISSLVRLCRRPPRADTSEALIRALDFYLQRIQAGDMALLADFDAVEAVAQANLTERPDDALSLLNWFGPVLIESSDLSRIQSLTHSILAQFETPSSEVAQAWLNLGAVSHITHDLVTAEDAFRRAYEAADTIGSTSQRLEALISLGEVAANTGELETAERELSAALEITRQIGDVAGEARVLRNVGYVCRIRRDFAQAIQHTTRALALHTLLGDHDGRVWCIGSLASCQFEAGQYQEALTRFSEALAIHRHHGNTDGIVWNLTSLADVSNKLGDFKGARRYALDALDIHKRLHTQRRAWPLRVLADTAKLEGDLNLADKLLLESLEVIRQSGDPVSESLILVTLAETSFERSEDATGLAYLDLAEQIGTRIDHPAVLHAVKEVRDTYAARVR
ncbi:MAG: tetratricopeptide repeat protein [Fimbriimonas sp.]|nr:tetratricopeptide repeat protein [Fimbriimonas sp.]